MRFSGFSSRIFLTFASPYLLSANPSPCLRYEPEIVELVGTMKQHRFAGPPNFESVKHGDAPEIYWLIHLAKPICTVSTDPKDRVNEPESKVNSLQIIIRDYKKYRLLLNKRVKIVGTLSHAITGHHHTKVLIDANSIEPAP